jgi:hypothetical protein
MPSAASSRSAERRKQRTVFGLELRPWVLTAKDGQLVTEDQDLHLFGVRRPPSVHQQLGKAMQRQVDEPPDHPHLQQDDSTRRRAIAC